MAALKEVPAGIEAKAWQFATMCLRDGYPSAVLTVHDGDISSLSLFDGETGEQHYCIFMDGTLVEYREVDDGRPQE